MVLLNLYCMFGVLLVEGPLGAFVKADLRREYANAWVGPLPREVFAADLWDAPGTAHVKP